MPPSSYNSHPHHSGLPTLATKCRRDRRGLHVVLGDGQDGLGVAGGASTTLPKDQERNNTNDGQRADNGADGDAGDGAGRQTSGGLRVGGRGGGAVGGLWGGELVRRHVEAGDGRLEEARLDVLLAGTN